MVREFTKMEQSHALVKRQKSTVRQVQPCGCSFLVAHSFRGKHRALLGSSCQSRLCNSAGAKSNAAVVASVPSSRGYAALLAFIMGAAALARLSFMCR